MHVFLATVTGLTLFGMVCHHPKLELMTVPRFWMAVSASLEKVLEGAYVGLSFSVAVLIWIAVSFRRDDWRRLLNLEDGAAAAAAGGGGGGGGGGEAGLVGVEVVSGAPGGDVAHECVPGLGADRVGGRVAAQVDEPGGLFGDEMVGDGVFEKS